MISAILGLLLAAALPAAPADQGDYVVVVVRQGESLRDIAARTLDDPDLWQEILRANGLESPASVRPGTTLRIPRTQVTVAMNALSEAQERIRLATEAGARIFAPERIDDATRLHDSALSQRKAGDWQRCLELARQAAAEAERAREETLPHRNADAQAVLASRTGQVQAQKSSELRWRSAGEGTVLVEREKVRTLSESRAEIVFVDESQLRLGPNSQAVIQKMRIDLLNHRQEATVSLVEGDVYALLGGSAKAKALDVQVAGVTTSPGSTDFWMNRRGETVKIANYDDAQMLVAAGGDQVALGRNQGTIVEGEAAPQAPRNLLSAPRLVAPEDEHVGRGAEIVLEWSAVPEAASYWLEVAVDATFRQPVVSRSRLAGNQERLEELGDRDYYWRISAVDELGFPGARSRTRRFRILQDQAAPFLAVRSPPEQAILRVSPARIEGEVERGATLLLNSEPVEVAPGGEFEIDLALRPGLNLLVLEVSDRSGNVTRRERSLVYMPDQPAAVEYDPVFRETGLLQIGERSFLTRRKSFVLTGRTRPATRIVVETAAGAVAGQTYAGPEGEFQVTLSPDAEHTELRLLVTAPSGYVTEDRFSVTRDTDPPVFQVEPRLPGIAAEVRLRLSGRVSGSDRLTLNGEAVAVDGESFAAELDLEPGENRVELLATDRVGNEARWERTVVLDRDPPELLSHAVEPATAAGGGAVEVTVRARDVSAMKRAARFEILVAAASYAGTLRLEADTGTYRGVLTLPPEALGPIRLRSVVLEDYNGNQKTYRF